MLKEYDSQTYKQFQIMDNEGVITNPNHMPVITDTELVKAYEEMLFARTVDMMIVSYQRQGRIFTYPPNNGQEAISGALGTIIQEKDWLVPAFRELGSWLAKGAQLKEIFLYFMGYEIGTKFEDAKNFLPIAVPIASQLQHAVGLGYAQKYQEKDGLVYAFVGDGGTSQGDFHEALNFAGVWKVPVIFIVQNNQFAISVPFKTQTASNGIAVKATAYGIQGIQVDGNDYFAMLRTLQEAKEYTSKGNGPILIEAVTYRKGAHTTSDDPSKYRSKEEEDSWEEKDPLKRLKSYLISKNLFDDKKEEKLIKQYKKEIDRIFIEAENQEPYLLEDVFKYQFAEMPDDLKDQMNRHEQFLNWKGGQN